MPGYLNRHAARYPMKILAGLTRLFEASSENHRGEGLRQMILACVICALAFVGAELANAPLGWEDELGFHFGVP